MRTLGLVALAALALAAPAAAQPAGDRCTRETLTIRGTPVVTSYCITREPAGLAGQSYPVVVAETFATPSKTFSRNSTLTFIVGEDPSRVIEAIPLDQIGFAGAVLHTTLVLHAGLVRVESAILTPGAVTIK